MEPYTNPNQGSDSPNANRKQRRIFAFKKGGPKVMTPGVDLYKDCGYEYNSKMKLKVMHPPARVIFKEYTRKSRAGVSYTHYGKFLQYGTYQTK